MKKLFAILTLCMLCVCCAVGFAACDNGKSTSEEENKQILQIYNTYVAYAEENGIEPKSYEEWLSLVKGEKGDKGDKGEDGITPTIEISADGYWVINGTKTEYKAIGQDGKDGKDGVNGKDGVGVKSTTIDSNGDLIITLTDNSVLNAGKMVVEENPQELDFYLKNDGTYEVKVGKATLLTEIVIPSTYKGKAVTSIGSQAFEGCRNLTSITIPDSVTSIGYSAFDLCSSLTSITIGNSVTSIGDYAFFNCDKLQYNEYENGLYLGNEDNPYIVLVKAKSTDITSCAINNKTKFIYTIAFSGCIGLTSITIPDSVTSIGEYAFCGCSGFTNITIGNSVTSIGEYAFSGCSSLTTITIPDSVTSIGEYAFSGCSSLTSITIPDSVTFIGPDVFSLCGLTSIMIPDSVKSIENWAFSGCSSLTSITFNGTKEQWQAIYKGYNWNYNVPATVVHCIDDDAAI